MGRDEIERGAQLDTCHTKELKRLAINVVALLPADEREAQQVLLFAHELVVGFFGDSMPSVAAAGNVISIKR